MISSQGQNAQSDQGNDILIALEKSLSMDDRSSGAACHTNGCETLDRPGDKELAHLKVRIQLHDDKEFHFPPGVTAVEPPIDANPRQAVYQGDRVSDGRPAVGRRLLRSVAFGVITPVMVGAAFALQFYGDDQRKHMVGAGEPHRVVASTNSSGSDLAVELASKTTALLQAEPVTLSAPGSVTPGSSPKLQHQLETVASDIAVVRRIVERLAAVQEQMALDIVTLQSDVSQKVSLPPHSPAVPVPPRKYVPNSAHSDVVVHSPLVPVPTAPARTPLALH